MSTVFTHFVNFTLYDCVHMLYKKMDKLFFYCTFFMWFKLGINWGDWQAEWRSGGCRVWCSWIQGQNQVLGRMGHRRDFLKKLLKNQDAVQMSTDGWHKSRKLLWLVDTRILRSLDSHWDRVQSLYVFAQKENIYIHKYMLVSWSIFLPTSQVLATHN